MRSVLRIYDPVECDEQGVPLDWEKCRACGGEPRIRAVCSVCAGAGSLKAAALAEAVEGPKSGKWHVNTVTGERFYAYTEPIRPNPELCCKDCDQQHSLVRTLGWPHDLRPEKLAVLCLRCFAERSLCVLEASGLPDRLSSMEERAKAAEAKVECLARELGAREASEWPGVVEGWKARAEAAEARAEALLAAGKELTATMEGLLGDRERALQADEWRIRCGDAEAERDAALTRAEAAERHEQEMARMWGDVRCPSCEGRYGHETDAGWEDCTACGGTGVSNEVILRAEKAEAERDALSVRLQEAEEIIERLVTYNEGAPWSDRDDAEAFLDSNEALSSPKPESE